MGILIGLVVTLGCVLGGFMAMGGHLHVLVPAVGSRSHLRAAYWAPSWSPIR